MPLYVGAVAMHSQRQQLLAADEMPVLHSKLVNLHITQRATADQLAVQVQLKSTRDGHALQHQRCGWSPCALCLV
jgi:hypothetical protein